LKYKVLRKGDVNIPHTCPTQDGVYVSLMAAGKIQTLGTQRADFSLRPCKLEAPEFKKKNRTNLIFSMSVCQSYATAHRYRFLNASYKGFI